jgi:hypothetical protein
MTKLETLHGQITKEQRRIEMLKNTKSNGDAEWYDFVKEEIKNAKTKISELQKEFNNEYEYQVKFLTN